jgi:hypothetical protein
MNILKVMLFFLEKQLIDDLQVNLTTNPVFNPNDFAVRKTDTTDQQLYIDCNYGSYYNNKIFSTIKIVVDSITYYVFFSMKEIKYTKDPVPSSILIARRDNDKVYIEKKLKINTFKDEQSLFDYLYNQIVINKINYSQDTTAVLETL